MALPQSHDIEDRLFTERLVLRAVENADAPFIAAFLSDWDVVKQTASVPYPYHERSALTWVARVRRRHQAGTQFAFAMTTPEDDRIKGAVALTLLESDAGVYGEVGYWLGRPHWGKGYASEAVGAVTELALDSLGLRRVEAVIFKENKASQRVLAKVGYRLERSETRNFPDRGGKRQVLIYVRRAGEN